MASTKTRTKTIRIANETADYFEDKPLNRMVECVHEMLASGNVGFDGQRFNFSPEMGVDTAEKSVDTIKKGKELTEIEEMVTLSGCTLEKFLKDVDIGLTEGYLLIDGGRLVMPEVNTDEFVRICKGRRLDPQEVLEKATQAVKRGQL